MARPLVVPLYRKARDGTKQIRLAAMARQMLDCLFDEQTRLLPRALFAEQRNEGSLAGIGVPPCRLPGCRLVAAVVDEIVGDLEREADVACISAIWSPPLGRQLGHDAGRLHRIFYERAGLKLLKARDRRQVE